MTAVTHEQELEVMLKVARSYVHLSCTYEAIEVVR